MSNPSKTRLKSGHPKALGPGRGRTSAVLTAALSPGSSPNPTFQQGVQATVCLSSQLGKLRHSGTGSSFLATVVAQKPGPRCRHPNLHPHALLPPHGTVPHRLTEGLTRRSPPLFPTHGLPFISGTGPASVRMNHRPLLSPPKPLGRRLLQPFTHTNKNKSRCRPLNSAKASFPLAPRAAWSCARGLGTLPADLALSLPAHPVSFSHRAARRAEWDVTAGTGVARGCQESAGYGLRKPPGQMPHTRVLPPPAVTPAPRAGGVGELPARAAFLRLHGPG